ncbi:MAG TPA: DUF882 domain-containing protein [Kofleriaceae bacterium]|nr:DUF882 domain-containing protein [Kofleriaceae bacterium]
MRLALALVCIAAPALAAPGYVAKKDRERATKAPYHGPLPTPGVKPAELIDLYNEHTHEWLAIDPAAPPDAAVLDEFLRDHFTNKSTTMDPHLLGILLGAAQHFHSDVVDVVSGFRHPKYNLMLRKKGHQVARDSQHTHGDAVDFAIPHVTTRDLHAWAKAQRLGGVGLYLESGFVHMDVGPIRYWSGD